MDYTLRQIVTSFASEIHCLLTPGNRQPFSREELVRRHQRMADFFEQSAQEIEQNEHLESGLRSAVVGDLRSRRQWSLTKVDVYQVLEEPAFEYFRKQRVTAVDLQDVCRYGFHLSWALIRRGATAARVFDLTWQVRRYDNWLHELVREEQIDLRLRDVLFGAMSSRRFWASSQVEAYRRLERNHGTGQTSVVNSLVRLSLDIVFSRKDRADEIVGDLTEYLARHPAWQGRVVVYTKFVSIVAFELAAKAERAIIAIGNRGRRATDAIFDYAEHVLNRAVVVGDRLLHLKHIWIKLALGTMGLELARRMLAKLLVWIG